MDGQRGAFVADRRGDVLEFNCVATAKYVFLGTEIDRHLAIASKRRETR